MITAEPTFWSAWGTQTLTNLGHVSNFAFGFLVGKGCANMAIGAGSAAAGASTAGEAVTTFGKTFAKDFAVTAKENLVQQFTGWNQGGLFCRFMKGFGLYGESRLIMTSGQMMKRALGRKLRKAVCRSSLMSLQPRVRRPFVSLLARRCIRSGDWQI